MRCKLAKKDGKGGNDAERGVPAKEEREREKWREVTEEEKTKQASAKQQGDAEKRRQTEKASDRIPQGATEKKGPALQSVEET